MPVSRIDVRRVMSEHGPECPQHVFVWELQGQVTAPEASRAYLHQCKSLDDVPLDEVVRVGRRSYVIRKLSGCVYVGQLKLVPGSVSLGAGMLYRKGPKFSKGIAGSAREMPGSGVSATDIKLFASKENRAVTVREVVARFRDQVDRAYMLRVYFRSLSNRTESRRGGPVEDTDEYFEKALKFFFTRTIIQTGKRSSGWRYVSRAIHGQPGCSTLDSLFIPPGVKFSET